MKIEIDNKPSVRNVIRDATTLNLLIIVQVISVIAIYHTLAPAEIRYK